MSTQTWWIGCTEYHLDIEESIDEVSLSSDETSLLASSPVGELVVFLFFYSALGLTHHCFNTCHSIEVWSLANDLRIDKSFNGFFPVEVAGLIVRILIAWLQNQVNSALSVPSRKVFRLCSCLSLGSSISSPWSRIGII